MTTTLNNVTISEKAHNGEKRIGRPTIHRVEGVWEVIARCEHPEGGQCFRSFGLFADLDSLPQWYWNAR